MAKSRSPISLTVALLLAAALPFLLVAFPLAALDDDRAPTTGELKRLMRQAIQAQDDAGLRELLLRLGRMPGPDGARVVLDTARALPADEETYYWFLLDAVSGFAGPEAFTEMGTFLVQYRKTAIARDLLHALQKNHSKYVNRVIRRVLKGCPLDLQLMAVDLAAQIPVRRTVDVLMPVLEREHEKEAKGDAGATVLKNRLLLALEALTYQRLGNSLPNWLGWWKANRHRGLKILREEAQKDDQTTGVVQPLDPIRRRQFFGLEKMPPGKVLVVKGQVARNGYDINFDHIEDVLSRLAIKHDVVQKDRLEESGFSLRKYAAVFINCTQINRFCQSPGHSGGESVGNRLRRCLGPNPHDEAQYKMKDPALKKIRKFVERGGYLFTEDWVLIEVLQPLFPKFVTSGSKLKGNTVRIRATRGQTSHPLLRGVFTPPIELDDFEWDRDEEEIEEENASYTPEDEDDPGDLDEEEGKTGVGEGEESPESGEIEEPEIRSIRHKWRIDNESPSLKIRSKKVKVLISSDDLKRQCGDPAVALTFTVGKGRVLHVLSHFGKQNSVQDEATIENLLINFLIEVNVRMGGI
ncbi:MAG: hypothetical protein ACE5GW_09475 [Planctomycetota bacterium]